MPGEHITQDAADEFALGACDPELAREVALHIIECPQCDERVNSAEDLTSRLALTAPRQRPAPALRSRVLQSAGLAKPGLFSRAARITGVMATVGALALAALAFGGFLALRSEVDSLRQSNVDLVFQLRQVQSQEIEIAALTRDVESTSESIEGLQQQVDQDKDLQLALLSPSSRTALVYSVEPDADSIGRFVWDPDQSRVWFFATGLAPLAAGDTYELFVRVEEGSYVSLGTFNSDNEGFVRFETESASGLDAYDSAVVTVEKRWIAGDRERTGPSVFVLDLTGFSE